MPRHNPRPRLPPLLDEAAFFVAHSSSNANEIPETVENDLVLPGIVDQLKFPNDPDNPDDVVGVGETLTLTKQGSTPAPDLWYHYEANVNTLQKHLLVQSGSTDVPPLKYRSLCLHLCSSGRHFLESFQHGIVFYNTDEADSQTLPLVFIQGIVAGKSWSQIGSDVFAIEQLMNYWSF